MKLKNKNIEHRSTARLLPAEDSLVLKIFSSFALGTKQKFLRPSSLTLYVFIFLISPLFTFAYQSPGSSSSYVNDLVGVLSRDERAVLENKLSQFEKDTGNEIAVVMVKNLGDDIIENYAVSLFQEWGIGKKGQDNGVLLLIAMDDRKMRIEVGYGLEGDLTDIQSSEVINNTLKPNFQAGKFFQGIDLATDQIMKAISGEARRAVPSSGFLFYVIFALIWLASILARSKSWWAGGIAGALFALLFNSFLAFIILVPVGFLFDFIVSRAYQRGVAKGHYPWWIGGGPSGGSGFGGGFGGFGGGRSGGGGSSGSW